MLSIQRLLIFTGAVGLAVFVSLVPGVAEPSLQHQLYLPLVSRNSFVADPRFGLIVGGDVADALERMGSQWWFSWGQPTPGGPYHRVGQISLRSSGQITRIPLATLQDGARQYPGGYWIVGNEPNVPGQDDVSPQAYVAEFKYYHDAIKAADSTAKLIAPNILNFDFTCSGCQGLTSGHDWLEGFRAAWAQQYGGEPPVDIWGIHAYLITWENLPMTDYATVQQQVSAFADYLGAIPTEMSKPVWLTEFGVIWGFPDYTFAADGCSQAPNCIAPVSTIDTPSMRAYLSQMLNWIEGNATRYRLEKWFVYTAHGQPEPYATVYGGISLLAGSTAGAPLTELGQMYYQHAMR